MALYDIIILKPPSGRKTIKLICALSGISEEDISQKLMSMPLVVKGSVPLSEAIEIDRQLKRQGVLTRIVNIESETNDTNDADSGIEPSAEEPTEFPDQEQEKNDVIEIPDDQIRILRRFHEAEPGGTLKRKKITTTRWWINWFSIPLTIAVLIVVSLYFISRMSNRQDEIEISLAISQWRNALHQQDLLLDKGIPPDRIFYQLDELEGKIERLLLLIHSAEKAKSLRSDFEHAKAESQGLAIDLAFRKSLVDAGYPIHPICVLDRGMVRGSSKLPESSLLRVQLTGESNVESVYFAARVSEGAFKLIIDPSIERRFYDARATVAPYSQQPRVIQRWAQRKFSLLDVSKAYLPAGGRLTSLKGIFTRSTEQPLAPPGSEHSGLLQPQTEVPLSDPGTDAARVREVKETVSIWTETILNARQNDLETESDTLDEIYRKLLNLEVRIDQLIGLLESTMERNIWIQRREDVYGSFIDTRRQIEQLYNDHSRTRSPIHLESSIRINLRERGYNQAEVLVIESEAQLNAFLIEVEIYNGELGDVLVTLAQAIVEEIEGLDFDIDRIMLRYKSDIMFWTRDQMQRAYDMLSKKDGRKHCIRELELSALSAPMQ